ncbi:helix-turn-helix domain-containing protein [uncultured Croceitalea sp.]|uniref:helix-turn-helix domain-containing protein n=1 Tax=uncultured Croceitalea sp. TaxID=1798908 RepID=UPI00374EC05A
MSHLLKYREQLNLTQEQLSAKANISVRTIQRIESGKELKGHTLEALAKALEISKEKLVDIHFKQKEDNLSLIKLINLSSLFFIIIPFGSIILPIVIMYWKQAFNPITKQIVSIQILWTVLFPLIVLASAFIGKWISINSETVPMAILLLLFVNAYIIIRNTIELDKNKTLHIKLKFSVL